jgi:anti-sigma B factor antagonist
MIATRTRDGITILDVHGALAAGREDAALRQAIRLAFDDGARTVILNLRDVPTIDSSGVAALASGHLTAVNHGGQLKLCELTRKLQDIFAVTRLDAVFDSYDTEAAAIASANVQNA